MSDTSDGIPLFEIAWDDSDITAVTNSIRRGAYWAKGPYVDKFETRLAEFLGVDHALVVNSGTTALVATLEGLDIGEGDEVIVPSFTFIATANAVRLTGAEPVFADIEPRTYGLSPADVEEKITDDTVGILPVHCYGTSCKIRQLADVAERHDILLIEDAAEALGAEYGGQKLGTFGDAAALSFCQNKITPTGEGGAVVTNRDAIASAVDRYRSHGRASEGYFESTDSGTYVSLGTNIRMSDLTAALGYSQLNRISALIKKRQRVANQYHRSLGDVSGVQPHRALADATHVYQLYTVELAEEIHRDTVIAELAEQNISSKKYWDPPVHQTKYYRETKQDVATLPVTEEVASRVLSLPMSPTLSDDDIKRVVSAITDALHTD